MVRRAKSGCLFAIFFFLTLSLIFSQQLPFQNYLEKDGLPSPIIYCIFQDSRGFLWIGTENGLSRFDGGEFKNFKKTDGLPDNIILSVYEDRWGKLWFGTATGGLSCFSDGRFTTYPGQSSLADNSIYSIAEDIGGKMWFGTSSGLSSFDGKMFLHYPKVSGLNAHIIFTIAIEKAGKLWLGTDQGIGCYEKDNLKLYSKFSLEDGLMDNYISALLIDSGGSLWIGTKKGLNRLKEGKLSTYTTKDGLSDNTITSLSEDRVGNLWIGTWNGVNLFSRGQFIKYSKINGLPNNIIHSICQDREGNNWFGTHGGASCLISSNVKTYSKEHGVSDNIIIKIIQDKKGKYWLGTSGGLSCYDGENFKNYTKKDGLASNTINQLMADRQGNIWIATPMGLSILSSGSFTNYTKKNGLPGDTLFDLIESRDGTIWIGGIGGLICWRDGQFFAPPFNLEQINVICIMEDSSGNLWFSSRASLYRYSRNLVTSISRRYDLPDDVINAIFEDSKGTIWIGTEGGISCFYNGKFTNYSTKNSALLENSCYFLLEDQQGKLWIGHSKGLSCFDGKSFVTYSSRRLGLSDRSWSAGIKNNSGELWFGTTDGVTTFYPPPVSPNSIHPPIYLTGVKAMENDIPLHGNNRFDYDQNIFRFDFEGCSFSPPSRARYKYMLENIDKEWRYTQDRSLFYPFLPPGDYNFKVKAINNDGFESETAAEYRFKILPPFWQTRWFLVIMGMVIILMVILVLHWRVKRIGEKAEIRARKAELEARNRQLIMSQRMELMAALAAGNVHDLKNLMAVIIAYSRVMSKKYRDDQEEYKNIEIIKETAATAVQMAKQILSFARPKSSAPHETVDLGQELNEIIATLKITQPKNIHILWEPPPEPILFPIHPARFQQVVMNLCLNACQAMPNGGELRICLSHESHDNEEAVTLEITDTGPGIQEEHLPKIFEPMFTTKEPGKGTGLGLFVVKQIVDEYHGTINVSSTPGKGAAFMIRFPLHIKKVPG